MLLSRLSTVMLVIERVTTDLCLSFRLSLIKKILYIMKHFSVGKAKKNMQQMISILYRDNEETGNKLITVAKLIKLNEK